MAADACRGSDIDPRTARQADRRRSDVYGALSTVGAKKTGAISATTIKIFVVSAAELGLGSRPRFGPPRLINAMDQNKESERI
jgi:hypothetical protein